MAAADHPATRAANLQARLRRLTPLLRRGEAYHVELDAIASELGELAMSLESYDPTCHSWRANPRAERSIAGQVSSLTPPRRSVAAAPGRSTLSLKGSHVARD